tara:strand:- start:10 stop:504 length:495 start_codon:yes stop_codon:yes gene_type:complete
MILKYLNKNYLINISFVFFVFLFDRLTKIYVIHLDNIFLGKEIYTSKFLNINLIWNGGIAFGLFSFDEKKSYNILTILILIVILVIIFMIIKSEGLKKYSLLMILGGGLGNLFDRIFYSAVPDFFDFHVGNLHWFVFNFADVFITLGVIFMILLELTNNNLEKI